MCQYSRVTPTEFIIKGDLLMLTIRKQALALSLTICSISYVYADDVEERKKAAMATTQEFAKKLGGQMQAAMKDGGPTNAVRVCSDVAPQLTGEMSRKTGWKVTRVGTKVRNSMLGTPDAWEQTVLAQFEERKAKGESLDKMAFSEVVSEPGGKYFRFMKAIGIQQGCLQCHGSKDQVLPEVEMVLEERYPHDLARDYKVGDLRGAISIKQPM